MAEAPHVRDATDTDFDEKVLQRSATLPVLVDFWAPWCAPCRQLGPLLERLATEGAGKWELVKVNVDENRRITTQMRIRNIPAVKAFKDGRIAGEFVGVLPETQLRAFLARLLPTAADEVALEAAAHEKAGDVVAAETGYRKALEADASHARAVLGLARILHARADDDAAIELLDRRPADLEAQSLRGRIAIERAGRSADVETLRSRVAAEPTDARARYDLGRALAARGEYEEALEHLLEVVRLDRSLDDDGGRKTMLDVFRLLGNDDERTRRFRRALAVLI